MSFTGQRLICFALLFGMTTYAIAAAVVLQMNGGVGLSEAPNELLETLATAVGATVAVVAVGMRFFLGRRAESLSGNARATARFTSVVLPLATLEAGCLFAITVWLLNGNAVPSLAVGLVLLAVAIAIVPFSDPDAA